MLSQFFLYHMSQNKIQLKKESKNGHIFLDNMNLYEGRTLLYTWDNELAA